MVIIRRGTGVSELDGVSLSKKSEVFYERQSPTHTVDGHDAAGDCANGDSQIDEQAFFPAKAGFYRAMLTAYIPDHNGNEIRM